MSSNSNTNPKSTNATATTSKDDPAAQKDAVKQQPQLSALEEDDEFEEFPVQGNIPCLSSFEALSYTLEM